MTDLFFIKVCAYEPCKKVFTRTNQTGFQWGVKRFCCQRCQILYNEHKDEPSKFKTCTRCKIEKHIFQFHRHRGTPDGHDSQCKTCKHDIHLETKVKTTRYGNSDLARDMARTQHLKQFLSARWK